MAFIHLKTIQMQWIIPFILVIWTAGYTAEGFAAKSIKRGDKQTVPTSSDSSDIHLDAPAGFTTEGRPFLGNPKTPVILEEYSDYLCPYCRRHFNKTLPSLIDKYVRTGKVKYVFRDYPLAGLHPTATKGSVAALCVAEQGAELFWKMHGALFRQQRQWSGLPDPAEFLSGVAKSVGANMEAYTKCVESGRKDAEVQKNIAAGKALEFRGTPSFQFIDSKSGDSYKLVGSLPLASFARIADALIAGEKPPEEPKPKPPELPFWAKSEGLTPDPAKPGFNTAGDAYKGNPDAKIVVVEYTDFQCPPCQKHTLEAQPEIDKRFVETGKVLWVVKHFPLRIHPHAPVAAVAAECAGDQGKFWEMHHLLFKKMDLWSEGDVDRALVNLAVDLQLIISEFLACFSGRTGLERVLKDLYDAQGVVTQTPTYVLLHEGKGSLIKGSSAGKQLTARFEKLLEKTGNPPKNEVSNK